MNQRVGGTAYPYAPRADLYVAGIGERGKERDMKVYDEPSYRAILRDFGESFFAQADSSILNVRAYYYVVDMIVTVQISKSDILFGNMWKSGKVPEARVLEHSFSNLD